MGKRLGKNVPPSIRQQYEEAVAKTEQAEKTDAAPAEAADAGDAPLANAPTPDTGHPGPDHAAPTDPKPEDVSEPGKLPEGRSPEPVSDTPPQPGGLTPQDTASEAARLQRALNTLQGKYNAELPRERARAKALEEQLANVTARLEALQAQGPRLPDRGQAPETVPAQTESVAALTEERLRTVYGLTDEEIQALPEEGWSAVAKIVRRDMPEIAGRVAQEQLAPTKRQLEEDAEVRFWSELSNLVPDWETINARDDWKEWLSAYDPMAMATRQELLERSQRTQNATSVAAFFDSFRRGQDGKPSSSTPSNAPNPPTPSPSVASQVMPRAAAASPPASGPPQVDEAEAIAMLEAVQKGHYGPPNSPKVREICQKIRAARAAGRIKAK